MKTTINKLCLLLLVTTLLFINCQAQDFKKYFRDETLRIDYTLTGNVASQGIALDGMSRMPGWYGKRAHMTEVPVRGAAEVTMQLASTGEIIYRQAFSTLFQEWLDLPDAQRQPKSFECVQLLPMPRDSVVVRVTLFNPRHEPCATIEHGVNPNDYTLRRIGEKAPSYVVLNEPADPALAINIAFVAEGYTQEQMNDYLADCRNGVEGLFSYEPFKSLRNRFRVIAVCTPSHDSGPSIPSEGIWHETTLGSSFDTFGMDRYLTTLRMKRMHDLLAGTPYEHIIVMVNTDKYGGGGIYNSMNLLMTKHKKFIEVLVHEFGHSFAGLADEYAYEGEEMNDFPRDVEPWAPNITTLTDFDAKWKDMLPEKLALEIGHTTDDNLDTATLGLYEGAGCCLKGVYRPCPNCMMRTLKVPIFCPVCRRAITQVINWYLP